MQREFCGRRDGLTGRTGESIVKRVFRRIWHSILASWFMLCYLINRTIGRLWYGSPESDLYSLAWLMPEVSVKPLIKVLRCDGDVSCREQCCWCLGHLGDKRAIPALFDELVSGCEDNEWWAANALGEIGGTEAREALIHALVDGSAHRHGNVALGLSKIGDPSILPLLIDLLDRIEPKQKLKVATAIARFGDKKTADIVISTLFRYPVSREYHYESDFTPLFGDYTKLILDAATIKMYISEGYRNPVYPMENILPAVKAICADTSQIATNLLHKIVARPGVRVDFGWTCDTGQMFGMLDFSKSIQLAQDELAKRGNPAYSAEAYLEAYAWTI